MSTSSNKLNLRQYLMTEGSQEDNFQMPASIVLKTEPCEEYTSKEATKTQKRGGSELQFKSMWDGDIQLLPSEVANNFRKESVSKDREQTHQQMRPITHSLESNYQSPTFNIAVPNLSKRHHQSDHQSINQHLVQQSPSQRTIIKQLEESHLKNSSPLRSKSKSRMKNSDIKAKFIGDRSMSDIDLSTEEHATQNRRLKSHNGKLIEKYQKLKIEYEKMYKLYQKQEEEKINLQQSKVETMTNQQLFEAMKKQSFWNFYMKSAQLIEDQLHEGESSSKEAINFMRELQALRQACSLLKKQNKAIKQTFLAGQQTAKRDAEKLEEVIEENRQFQSKIADLTQALKEKTDSQKTLKEGFEKVSDQLLKIQKSFKKKTEELQQTKILYDECEKQRVSQKKKVGHLEEQVRCIKERLQIQEREFSNQDQKTKLHIEKQKLKQKVFNIQKELNVANVQKQEISTQSRQYFTQLKEQQDLIIELKQSLTEKYQQIEQAATRLEEKEKDILELTNQSLNQKRKVEDLKVLNCELQQRVSKCASSQQALQKLQKQFSAIELKVTEQSKALKGQQECIEQLKQEKQTACKQLQMISESRLSSVEEAAQTQEQTSQKDRNCQHLVTEEEYQNFCYLEEYCQSLEQKIEEISKQNGQRIEELQQKLVQQIQQSRQRQEVYRGQQTYQRQIQNVPQEELMDAPLQMWTYVETLLEIKQQIIRKVLVLCPTQYRHVLIDYLYFGDKLIEEQSDILKGKIETWQQSVIQWIKDNNHSPVHYANCQDSLYQKSDQSSFIEPSQIDMDAEQSQNEEVAQEDIPLVDKFKTMGLKIEQFATSIGPKTHNGQYERNRVSKSKEKLRDQNSIGFANKDIIKNVQNGKTQIQNNRKKVDKKEQFESRKYPKQQFLISKGQKVPSGFYTNQVRNKENYQLNMQSQSFKKSQNGNIPRSEELKQHHRQRLAKYTSRGRGYQKEIIN